MSKNVKTEYKNGVASLFITQTSDDIHLPNLGFEREEDAELAVAIAKALHARGKSYWSDLPKLVKFTFRLIGITDSGWTE